MLISLTYFIKCCNKKTENYINLENKIVYEEAVSTIILNNSLQDILKNNQYTYIDFLNKSKQFENINTNMLKAETKDIVINDFLYNNKLYDLSKYNTTNPNIKYTDRYLFTDEIFFIDKGQILIELTGNTKVFNKKTDFNKLLISVGICLFINDNIKYETWNNCDMNGRCSFKLSYLYSGDLINSIKIGLKYDDNTSSLLTNIPESDKNKYRYLENNGCENIMIKITNISNIKKLNNELINFVNDVKKNNNDVLFNINAFNNDLKNITSQVVELQNKDKITNNNIAIINTNYNDLLTKVSKNNNDITTLNTNYNNLNNVVSKNSNDIITLKNNYDLLSQKITPVI